MQPAVFNFAQDLLTLRGGRIYVVILTLAALLALSGAFVHYTGGTQHGYLHIFYIPIVLGGFFFSLPGGITVGLLSTLILGPLMPMNVGDDLAQLFQSWVTRGFFFLSIGALSGLSSMIFRAYLKELDLKVSTNAITELPNFVGLSRKFSAIRKKAGLKIVALDVKNLKEIEKTIGPVEGEELLRLLAKRLLSLTKDVGILGHTDPAGFTILIPKKADLLVFLHQCQYGFSFTVHSIPIFVEVFCGIVEYSQDGKDLSTLLRKAKTAITTVDHQGHPYAHYKEDQSNPAALNIETLHDLKEAIVNEELTVHYQPIVEIRSGKVVGCEALARWDHPTRGMIPPNEFIPLTERTLLINPFTRWLIKHTLTDLKYLHHNRGMGLTLSINLSMKNFTEPDIFSRLRSLVREMNLKPENVEIEITESAVTPNMAEVASVIKSLRKDGFLVAMDDFGTGQASQQYLFELPLDLLKIDQIFVRSVQKDPAATAIVKSAIRLAHEFSLKVIAEGVETKEIYESLKKMKCNMAQGYWIAPPMPFNKLVEWTSKRTYKKAR